MKIKVLSQTKITSILLSVLLIALFSSTFASSFGAPNTFSVKTSVTAGEGWISTVGSASDIAIGTNKHFRIKPARGYMIDDVKIDGESIGPSMFATIPAIRQNHTVTASFIPFDQTEASNVSSKLTDDAKILIIGDINSVPDVRSYLEFMMEADPEVTFNVFVDLVITDDDLLSEYYSGRSGPESNNLMQTQIERGYDYIIPLDLYSYQSDLPELHMEGLRLIHNRGYFQGGQAKIILPMLWYGTDAGSRQTDIAHHTYRIANGFRFPVLPVGYAWTDLLESGTYGQAPPEAMNSVAAYVFAATLYAELFEKDPGQIDLSEYNLFPANILAEMNTAAWSAWQTQKTATHYSGEYAGITTPFNIGNARGYHFGTSTRDRSVARINDLIASRDPEIGSMPTDFATSFGAVLTDGSVQDNLSSQSYDYMWRQWKGENSQDVLDSAVRNQYGQDPYFIWYERYFDRTADFNAALIGLSAFREASSAKRDNDFSTNNPNKKSRAPQTHVGWGRIWEERTDIQMMENLSTTPAHSHDVLMSLFAAQSYALITGNDASEFGTWLYDSATDPDLAEKSAYAQRVGYVTVMQLGTLDIHEPYNESAYDLAAFNGNSIFAETTAEVAATDDSYLIEKNETLSQPAPGILTNDFSSTGSMIPLLVTNVVTGTLTLNNDGSFEYIPPNEFAGDVSFTYLIADGPNTSNEATVSISVAESISQIYLPYLVR